MISNTNPTDILSTVAFDEAYVDLCRWAEARCRDTGEAEELVSDTVLSLVQDVRAGKVIDNLPGYLRVVFNRRQSDRLRRKYRTDVVFSDDGTILDTIPDDHDPAALAEAAKEAEAVRRALARLSALYREVVYRHYMRGESVETIAAALGVPVGTVKSRLSDGRARMKGTVEEHLSDASVPQKSKRSVAGKAMNEQKTSTRSSALPTPDTRPYAELSYAPKTMTIGIWGNNSRRGEPFCYTGSLLAQNILILAYEKPISIRELSASLDTAAAFVEHEVDRLVAGELLGRTAGGLVYTRMFLQSYEQSFGDIPAQESLATEIAPTLWRILGEHTAPLWAEASSATRAYSAKQLATFRLFLVNHTLSLLLHQTPAMKDESDADVVPPLRPNGGWWLATGTVYAYGAMRAARSNIQRYNCSGPAQVGIGTDYQEALMYDFQSVFGNTHWAYTDMPGFESLGGLLSLYASLFNEEIKPQNDRIYECVPHLEALSILHRDADGVIHPDIPGMPLDEWNRWQTAISDTLPDLVEVLAPRLIALREQTVNRVPDHVDGRAHYIHASAFGCIIPATMRALCEQGCIPHVEMGKTPVIFVAYRAPEKGDND